MNCIEAPFQCHRKSGGKIRKNHLTCHGWPAALAAPWDLAELSGEHHGKIHLKHPETVSLTPQRLNSGSEVWHSFTMNVLSILLPIWPNRLIQWCWLRKQARNIEYGCYRNVNILDLHRRNHVRSVTADGLSIWGHSPLPSSERFTLGPGAASHVATQSHQCVSYVLNVQSRPLIHLGVVSCNWHVEVS